MRWIALAALAVLGGVAGGNVTVADDVEWKLLHDAATTPADSLLALSNFYSEKGAWDEYSAVRGCMLARVKPGPGPAPGGPFPRIGLPREGESGTILSR